MDERLPGLDALRVGLILLGIPFHAALPFATDSLGLIHADRSSATVAVLVVVLRALRMPTFFLVAGFFAARLLARRPADVWLRDRIVRLVLPLCVALVTIVPLQRAIVAAYRADSGIWIGAPQPTFHHLWFLVVLLGFCLAVIVARPILDRLCAALDLSIVRRAPDLAFAAVVVAAVAWELAIKLYFDAEISPEARLAGTTRLALVYLPWFVFGYALARIPGAMARFSATGPATVILALGFLTVDVAVARVPNLESFSALHLAAWTAASWYVARFAVGLTAKLAFASSPRMRRLGDWTMPIYIVHHPWTLAAALLLLPTGWSAATQFVLATILATAGTFVTCVVIDRSTVLALLVNGRRLLPLATRPAPRLPAGAAETAA